MAAKLTQHCTHGDKTYEAGEIVKNAKIAKILMESGVAEEVVEEKSEEKGNE